MFSLLGLRLLRIGGGVIHTFHTGRAGRRFREVVGACRQRCGAGQQQRSDPNHCALSPHRLAPPHCSFSLSTVRPSAVCGVVRLGEFDRFVPGGEFGGCDDGAIGGEAGRSVERYGDLGVERRAAGAGDFGAHGDFAD